MKNSLKFLSAVAGAATLLGAGIAKADIYVTDNTSDQLTIIGAGGTLSTVSNPMSQSFLNSPTGIAVDNVAGSKYDGDVFVANSVGTIVVYNPTTQQFLPTAFATGLGNLEGIAFDSSGNLYVSNSTAGTIAQYSGINLTSVNSTYGSGLTNPFDVTATGAGQLYVTTGSGLIKQIAAGGGAATSFTPSVTPSTPAGIVIGPNGDLYVVNTGTPNVEQIKVNGNSSTAVATAGGNLSTPEGLIFDANGDLYVADLGNNTVTEYTFGTINQLGQTTYNYLQTFGPTDFGGPLFLAFDPASSAVPEPGTYALLLGGLAALYVVQRRRKLAPVNA